MSMEGRQPSRDGTSRMTREYQVRFCESSGEIPRPTRKKHALPHCNSNAGSPRSADIR